MSGIAAQTRYAFDSSRDMSDRSDIFEPGGGPAPIVPPAPPAGQTGLPAANELLQLAQADLIAAHQQAVVRQSAAVAGLEERFRAIQESLQNLLTLFHEEQRVLVSEFQRDTAQMLAALHDQTRGMLDAGLAQAQARLQNPGLTPSAPEQGAVRPLFPPPGNPATRGAADGVETAWAKVVPISADAPQPWPVGQTPGVSRNGGGAAPEARNIPAAPILGTSPAPLPDLEPVTAFRLPVIPPPASDSLPQAEPQTGRFKSLPPITAPRHAEPATTSRLVFAPFENFTSLIRFESALKRLEVIRKFRSRNFRGGRFEVTLDHDPEISIVDAVFQIPGHRIELASANGDTYVFRMIGLPGGAAGAASDDPGSSSAGK